MKRNNRPGRQGRQTRKSLHFTPAQATMEIRDVDHHDADTGVEQLTDDAVQKGRDWVTFLQL